MKTSLQKAAQAQAYTSQAKSLEEIASLINSLFEQLTALSEKLDRALAEADKASKKTSAK